MKRIIKVLVVSALMVVLMATTVSPAFADAGGANDWRKDNETKWGWQCGTDKHNPVYNCHKYS